MGNAVENFAGAGQATSDCRAARNVAADTWTPCHNVQERSGNHYTLKINEPTEAMLPGLVITNEQKQDIIANAHQAFDQEIQKEVCEIPGAIANGVGKGLTNLAKLGLEIGGTAREVIGVKLDQDRMTSDTILNPAELPRDKARLDTKVADINAKAEVIAGAAVTAYQKADAYLFEIGFTGDYSKPVKDLTNAYIDFGSQSAPKQVEQISEFTTETAGPNLMSKVGGAFIGAAARSERLAETSTKFDSLFQRMDETCSKFDDLRSSESLERTLSSDMMKSLPEKGSQFDLAVKTAVKTVESRLSPEELEIAQRLGVTGWASVALKHGEQSMHTLGTFLRSTKSVDISEWAAQGNRWIRNSNLPGTVCHEFGHAVNVMKDKSCEGIAMSDTAAFKSPFGLDWANNQENFPNEMRALFSRQSFYKMSIDKSFCFVSQDMKPVLDAAKVRDEVFAELFNKAKGFEASSDYAELLRKHFPKTFTEYMEKNYGWRN